jgi:gamma-glutamyltranspeptidase/glutathione hydrolase
LNSPLAYSKTILAEHAAVASEQPLASLAGYDVLRKGGNAFDAAVATSLALAVTFHPAGGLGGDFFGMFYEAKSGKVHCLMSSGWSPSGLTIDLVKSGTGGRIPLYGPLSCVIPGYVAGICEMHRKLGHSEFKEVAFASAELASKGFPAGEGICRSTAGAYKDLPDEAKSIFAPNGRPPTPGDWIKQERLGQVISEIAEGGPEAFYSGWPAERIRDTLDGLGVPTTTADLRDFKPEWVPPLKLDYGGTTVYEMPPNTMGATSLLILKLLSPDKLSKTGPASGERVQVTMEAALTAYARRDEMLGDPRFGKIDIDEFMNVQAASGVRQARVGEGDTTAFSVADADGNLVSGVQSLFHHFGSRVFVPECGVFLNNRGSGFSMAGPNKVEPRKRPLHTLSSVLLEREGRPYLAIGTSGGDYRPLQHALFVTNLVDYKMPLEQAVGYPRFLWGGGNSLLVEDGFERAGKYDFDVQWLPMPGKTGVCQAVEISGRSRKAVCDVRGDGLPAGF